MYIPGTRANSQRTPTKGVMYRVCGLWLCPNLGVRLRGDENVYLPLTAEKCMHLTFSQKNIYNDTAVVAPILRLRLTV